MRRSLILLSMASATLLLISACGGGGSDTNATDTDAVTVSAETDAVTPEMLTGIWSFSEAKSDGTEDIIFSDIDAGGVVTFYDYQGDSYNQGETCYKLETDYELTLIPLDTTAGEYSLIVSGFGATYSPKATLALSNQRNTLTMTYIDLRDEDGDGNMLEDRTRLGTRQSELTSADLAPVCAM